LGLHQRTAAMYIASLTRLFCLNAFVLFAEVLLAQAPAIEWQRALGGSLDEQGFALDLTSDGGYIIAGLAFSSNGNVTQNQGQSDVWVVKLNAAGEIVWQRTYGGSAADRAYGIRQLQNGGYVVAGASSSTNGDITVNQGGSDYWVFVVDAMGNMVWERTYGGSGADVAFDIDLTSDGGFVVIGESASNNGDITASRGTRDCWLIKLTSTGLLEWERSYGGTSAETGWSVRQTADGGYIIGATTSSTNGDITTPLGAEDFWVIKTDAQGTIVWQRNYGGTNSEINCVVRPTADDGFALVGGTVSSDGDITQALGLVDHWVAKLSNTGDVLWSRSLGGSSSDGPRSLDILSEGDLLITGYADSNDGDVTGSNGTRMAWVFRLSATGNLLWDRAMGGSGNDTFFGGLPAPDGGYILTGSTTSNNGDVTGNNGGSDMWVVKLATDPTSVAEHGHLTDHSVWPNPTTGHTWLDVKSFEGTWLDVRYYATNGSCVRDQRMNLPGAANTPVSLDLSGLPQGLYHVILSDGVREGVVRLVKE